MAKKLKKREHETKNKKSLSGSLKKSLRQSTHPIPSEKVESDEKKYDRRRSKDELKKEIKRALKN